MAYKIASDLRLRIKDECELNEIKQVEFYLRDYQIIVFDCDAMNAPIYIGQKKEKQIYLYHRQSHFDTIKYVYILFFSCFFQ